jgi:hypothetical protein
MFQFRIRLWNAIVVPTLIAGVSQASDRMVGVRPTDGATQLVKRFDIGAGVTITGMQFENNDPSTIFPEVSLVRGPLNSIAEGTVVASTTGVRPGSGTVTITWPSPVEIGESGTYYAAIRFPAGAGRQGPGRGPAIGANDAAVPRGSFITCGAEGSLLPAVADLGILLVLSGGGVLGGPAKTSERLKVPQGAFGWAIIGEN